MDFTKKVPDWKASGTEPPDTLKQKGFEAGYKPPASYFNWFWSGVSSCLAELQTKVKALYAKTINGKSLEADVTLSADDVGAATKEHSHSNATANANGFMSKDDKAKLDGIASGATKYSHPTTAGYKHIPSGGAQGQMLGWSADGTAKWAVPQTMTVEATSTDGVIYNATASGITQLVTGMELVIIPDKLSTNVSTKLNVNGLGDILIRFATGYNTAATVAPVFAGWMSAGKPISLRYNGQYWIVTDSLRLSNHMIYGTVEIEHGGTGADNAEEARENLGAEQARTKVTGTGAITFTVANYNEYSYTAVTSLKMTGAAVDAHGFVTFGSSAPTINVSGFTASGGDDITKAAAREIWEFSVYPHNNGSFVIWKNWSA